MASKKKTRTFVRETQAWNLCILERVTSQLDGGQKARKACRYSPPPPLPLKRARCSSHLSLFRSIVVVRANLHRRAAPRRAENSANPLWTGQESGGGMSLLNASRQPMHANAYLTGLQAPSFTTPEPVDLRSPPGPIGSPRFSPSLPLSFSCTATNGIPGLFDGQRSLTFYLSPLHGDIGRRPFALNSRRSIGSRIGSNNNYGRRAANHSSWNRY